MTTDEPAFARDPATARYYDQRAAEYDEWYEGVGRFAQRDRPGWAAEVARLVALVEALPPGRTLDVACGSGFLTRHLRGAVVGVDQSPSMAAVARNRLPRGAVLVGDALHLPFTAASFGRVLTGHFYGHLPAPEREAFLAESRRVAAELVVVDSAARPGVEPEQWQERVLNDGSRHRVYKRYLAADQLADEIGGEVLLDGPWFVAARRLWGSA
jgi:ubiquinone/menaquinone biosynthesis C-methylase UbiE